VWACRSTYTLLGETESESGMKRRNRTDGQGGDGKRREKSRDGLRKVEKNSACIRGRRKSS